MSVKTGSYARAMSNPSVFRVNTCSGFIGRESSCEAGAAFTRCDSTSARQTVVRVWHLAKWLDLSKLVQTLLPKDTIQELHYFAARVSSRAYNPSSAHDQGLYIRALRTIPNLHIKYGRFLTHSVPMYLTDVVPAGEFTFDFTQRNCRPPR